MSKSSKQHENDNQTEETRKIIDDCVRRRAAGEDIDTDNITAAHQDLMPQLGRELERIKKIEDARQEALQELPALSHETTWGLGAASEPPPSGVEIDTRLNAQRRTLMPCCSSGIGGVAHRTRSLTSK